VKTEPLQLTDRPQTLERRVLAVVCSVLLHVVLLAGGAVATAIVATQGQMPALPRKPLLVLAVALLLAHCSLGAIWWARTNWSPHAKTLVAALSCGGLWLLLITLLDMARHNGLAAAAWAACVATQVSLTALAAAAMELALHYQSAATRSRFSILYLMVWTSVIAAALGIAGIFAARSGFKLSEIPSWEHFRQIQGVGLAGAALAIGVYASVRLPRSWNVRIMTCVMAVIAIAIGAVLSFLAVFGDKVGASTADIAWLIGGEGLFLVVTLVPLEMVRERYSD
jgi:hypothetical protein